MIHPLLGLHVASERELTPIRAGGSTGKIGSFGMTRVAADGTPKMHKGVDFLAVEGWPVHAAHDGWVDRAGWENPVAPAQGYGQRVWVQGEVERTVYAHLSELFVTQGQQVKVGDVIGRVGRTGNVGDAPTHLHFEVHVGGAPMDPMASFV